MEILLIIFLIILVGIGLFLLFKIVRWVFHKKARIVWMLILLTGIMVSVATHRLFFVKMEFVQSKVYPNLYLIKNEIKDRDSLDKLIKEKVVEMIDNNLVDTKKRYSQNTHEAPYATLAFYTYTKNSVFSVFQDYGTAYFIDNEEDLGGMIVEDLQMYQNYKLATYNIRTCKNDTTHYCGVLEYYKNGYIIKTVDIDQNQKTLTDKNDY